MTAPVVRVHDLTSTVGDSGRLSIVSGLCPATEAISDGYASFLPDAVAPRGEWRAPTAGELGDLTAVPGAHDDAEVLVVPLPRLGSVLGDHLQRHANFSNLPKPVGDDAFLRLLENCIEDLIPFCTHPGDLACQGVWANPGGVRLLTLNMQVTPPRRIGLHVDNWDDLPLIERGRGRRRLCVNLGRRPRYLIFLRDPLSALVAAGELPAQISGRVSPAAMLRAYLSENLDQPAARVRIDPGEAYIVNADDVIHDGASDAADAVDIALHFLGHFGIDGGEAAETS
jgi:hypothetical protein